MGTREARRWAVIRRRLYRQLEPTAWIGGGLSPANRFISLVIVAAVVLAVLESEPTLSDGNALLFLSLQAVLSVIFLVEYVLRVWVAVENPEYRGKISGRLRYMTSFSALVDLLAIIPIIFIFVGNEFFLLRLVRLIRIFQLARLGRYSRAMADIIEAIKLRRYELIMSIAISGILLLVSSTFMYVCEGGLQPDSFGSIPRAMWWSIATLTTVGYGDVYPLTTLGKVLAGITALTGIGLIAMPTGILAAAFSEVIQKRRSAKATPPADLK